eukprot:1161192-Pelagomonas_calceolata.AAC.5
MAIILYSPAPCGAAAAVASSPALAGDEPAQAAVEEDEATEDMLLSSLPSGKAKSKKQQQQQPRNGNASGAANRPVGGVQVLYKSSKKGKATGGAGGRLGNFVARQMQMGGVQMGGDGAAGSARALETWQALQSFEHNVHTVVGRWEDGLLAHPSPVPYVCLVLFRPKLTHWGLMEDGKH